MTGDQSAKTLTLNLDLAAPKDGKAPATRAYLFDTAGRLVYHAPAKPRLEIPFDPAQGYRLTVGPDLVTEGAGAPQDLAAQLVQAGAVSRDVSPLQQTTSIAMVVRENLSLRWLRVCMNIHGTVRKLLNPGGAAAPSYAPIRTGTVQIFLIDLARTLDAIGDAELLNIRNQTLSRMLGMEIVDILTMNWGDLARINALAVGLVSRTGDPLRAYIVANRAALAPFMCGLISEVYVSYQELPDAAIQSDGSFSLPYCFFIWQLPADLYFEVVQNIDGADREVADPDIVCTTQWAYDGSTSVTITVDDPSAIAGTPDPRPAPTGLYVWPTAIGNIDLGNIDGLETTTGTGLLPNTTAWGGTLCLQMQFHPDLQANGILYYRWSYQFDGDAGYTQINASVTHRWQDVTMSGSTISIHLHPKTLGPQLVGTQTNLFEIPDPRKPWIDIDDPADRPFAYFDSTAGQTPGRSGMCTLKLEMFDALGNRVPSTGGAFQYLLPDSTGGYSNAPAPNVDADGDLVFRIRVDNNPTVAALPSVSVAGATAADDCGIYHYRASTDTVAIAYVATQPSNFIDWTLNVSRGLHGVVASVGRPTSSANPDHFDNSAGALVNPCAQAAFAVNLYCAARIESGYGRQTQYDRSATIAFALLTP